MHVGHFTTFTCNQCNSRFGPMRTYESWLGGTQNLLSCRTCQALRPMPPSDAQRFGVSLDMDSSTESVCDDCRHPATLYMDLLDPVVCPCCGLGELELMSGNTGAQGMFFIT